MNKEYIERDAAVAFLENMAASRYLIQCFENKERFPTADVVPVVHGEWIDVSEEYCMYPFVYCCSICNYHKFTDFNFNYCPNCGTYMDGGNKNDC